MLPHVRYVHFAPPCGSASKARDRWWTKTDDGRPPPRPLRCKRWPMGKPNLQPWEQARVDTANRIYEAVAKVITECTRLGVTYTIENPTGSYMWDYPHIRNAIEETGAIKIDFQACMWGSKRDKWTRFVTNSDDFRALEKKCDKSHEHAPWGRVWDPKAKRRTWATEPECEYTPELCKKIEEISLK